MTSYPSLFSPVRVGTHTLPNRIVHASTSTHYAVGGRVTDRLIDYYVNRARGGAAMLVSEPMAMLSWQAQPTRPHVLSGVNADLLPRWAEAVARAGGLMLGQIQDNGRGFRAGHRNLEARGASALPDDLSWTVPQVLETGEVHRMIDEFATSAATLAGAGFAGVEISAGHGHLFHQFLAARSNRREDEFGGDLEGRARLLLLLIRAIRERCGADFLIGVKLPADSLGALTAALAAKDLGVLAELSAGLPAVTRDALLALPSLFGGREVLDEAARRLPDHPLVKAALADLGWLAGHLAAVHPEVSLGFDLADLHGYAYYTGIRFAAYAAGCADATCAAWGSSATKKPPAVERPAPLRGVGPFARAVFSTRTTATLLFSA